MSATSPTRPGTQNGRRSNSLVGQFIKRTRSSDLLGERKASSTYMRTRVEEETQRGNSGFGPPTLPTVAAPPQLQTFGGENYTPKMDVPRAPDTPVESPIVHTRAESMTHRGRYSYAVSTASSINSPRRMRRRKDPTAYNVLIIGARNSGKTSFLNFLKSSLAPQPDQQNARNPELDGPPPSAKKNPGTFIQHYQEIDVDAERIGISIWDSPGFDKSMVDFQLKEMSSFVESKFEDTFIEEMKVIRAPGYRDTHIHCVFFLFDPAQLDINLNAAKKPQDETSGIYNKPSRIIGALDEDFELQILKSLQGKTTVIPVISKADTVTTQHMEYLKKKMGESFLQAGLDPLEALHFEQSDNEDDVLDEADEDAQQLEQKEPTGETQENPAVTTDAQDTSDDAAALSKGDVDEKINSKQQLANIKRSLSHKRDGSKASVSSVMFVNGYMPMSILSPDEHSLDGRDGPVGRRFVWGFADPYNPQHCDFIKLKETCFMEWRAEFKEASREVFYERWRTTRLNKGVSNGYKKSAAPAVQPTRKPSGGIPIELVPRTRKYT